LKITLCLIVWNELEGCKLDVPHLPKNDFYEVIAVDGGSTDGTVEYLESQGIAVYKQTKRGLNAAYVHANEVSKGDAVVVFFAKGTLPTEDVLKFRPLFESGNDLVIASRQLPGSVNEEDAHFLRPRKWAVISLAYLAALLWCREGNIPRDVLHGFKGWKRDAFAKMKVLDTGLSIDVEMIVRSYKLKLKRIEFPTKELPRGYGETHFKIWPTGKRLLAYLWYELWRQD
jgi:glycosyltransferase involved in cell wall biosynthesis